VGLHCDAGRVGQPGTEVAGADLLAIESNLCGRRVRGRGDVRSHYPSQGAWLAREAGVKHLVLHHISRRYNAARSWREATLLFLTLPFPGTSTCSALSAESVEREDVRQRPESPPYKPFADNSSLAVTGRSRQWWPAPQARQEQHHPADLGGRYGQLNNGRIHSTCPRSRWSMIGMSSTMDTSGRNRAPDKPASNHGRAPTDPGHRRPRVGPDTQ